MAKDPAILWYWSDWNGGTVGFSRHLKGCYIDLLYAQFNIGRLSLAQIKTILGVDFGSSWPLLQEKFKRDDNGNYYNERAEKEKEKRKRFTESRRNNLNNKPHMDKHMESHMKHHMENTNRNVLKEGSLREGIFFPTQDDVDMDIPEIKIGGIIQHMAITKKKRVTPAEVLGLWKVFKIQNFTGKKPYNGQGDVYTHFMNWCKNQDIEEVNKGGQSGSAPPLTIK